MINIPKRCTQLEALAVLEWGFRRGAFRLSGIYQDVAKVQDELLQLMLISPINFSEADIAAVVWSAVRSCLVSQLQASSQPQQGPFLDLKAGLEKVRNEVALLPPDIRVEFATLEMRLLSSLDEENRFGVNEVVRSERTRVLEALNKFCIRSLNKAFNRFCYP
ncbi:MAG: hypothetical protein MN733_14955 [Nitrososphaera sp.]|nr:hypothetical protein [Nitrososphaera sp.]